MTLDSSMVLAAFGSSMSMVRRQLVQRHWLHWIWPHIANGDVHLECFAVCLILACGSGHRILGRVEGQNCRFFFLIAIVTLSMS